MRKSCNKPLPKGILKRIGCKIKHVLAQQLMVLGGIQCQLVNGREVESAMLHA